MIPLVALIDTMGRGAGSGAGTGAGSGGKSIDAWPAKGDGMRKGFIYSEEREPHIVRQKEILKKYPEIQKLYGSDWRPAPFAVALVVIQIVLAYYQKNWSIGTWFFVAWIYGGAASHALSLMTHELSHNLLFASPKLNEYFGIFCNIGMGIPSSTMFKRYHMEHHLYQGDFEKDQVSTQKEYKRNSICGLRYAPHVAITPTYRS